MVENKLQGYLFLFQVLRVPFFELIILAYGRDLQEAQEWCRKYRTSGNDSDLNQAWELYCIVFRKINKQLPQLTQSKLELQYVSPRLLHAKSLTLAVPGALY